MIRNKKFVLENWRFLRRKKSRKLFFVVVNKGQYHFDVNTVRESENRGFKRATTINKTFLFRFRCLCCKCVYSRNEIGFEAISIWKYQQYKMNKKKTHTRINPVCQKKKTQNKWIECIAIEWMRVMGWIAQRGEKPSWKTHKLDEIHIKWKMICCVQDHFFLHGIYSSNSFDLCDTFAQILLSMSCLTRKIISCTEFKCCSVQNSVSLVFFCYFSMSWGCDFWVWTW